MRPLTFRIELLALAGLWLAVVGLASPATSDLKKIRSGCHEILTFTFADSRLYPGTTRQVQVYVPDHYRADAPACLYVCLDGMRWNAEKIFDHLITAGEMPVTIGVFVQAGVIYSADGGRVLRHNRSFEFDRLDDRFARFLEEEILPAVEKLQTSDGRAVRLSRRATDRAIAGASSGGICAFTAAWHRPDLFNRVFSTIGTFVAMRGGDTYSALVRKTEPKPLRIFLQDGSNDTWNPLFGNWWTNNRQFEESLVFAGYEVNHAWGDGGHDHKHGTAIFPDVVRWLWAGWPEAPQAGASGNDLLQALLIPGESWQVVNDLGSRRPQSLIASPDGDVFFHDLDSHRLVRLAHTGEIADLAALEPGEALAACDATGRIFTRTDKNNVRLRASGGTVLSTLPHQADRLLCDHRGNLYVVENAGHTAQRLRRISSSGQTEVVTESRRAITALALSPDHSLLVVACAERPAVDAMTAGPDDTWLHREPYYTLHARGVPFEDETAPTDTGPSALAFDRAGNLYAATGLGVQICDRNGRVRGILPLPRSAPANDLCFGGVEGNILYVLADGQLYARRLKIGGLAPSAEPVTLPKAGQG